MYSILLNIITLYWENSYLLIANFKDEKSCLFILSSCRLDDWMYQRSDLVYNLRWLHRQAVQLQLRRLHYLRARTVMGRWTRAFHQQMSHDRSWRHSTFLTISTVATAICSSPRIMSQASPLIVSSQHLSSSNVILSRVVKRLPVDGNWFYNRLPVSNFKNR